MQNLTKNIYFSEHKKLTISDSDKQRIANKIQEKIEEAEKFGLPRSLKNEKIKLTINNSVKRIGLARLQYSSDKNIYFLSLEVNINAFNEDSEYLLKNIIPHEVAHLICFINYTLMGKKIRTHGKEFKFICDNLGGLSDVKVDHFKSMRTSETSRKSRALYRYIYKDINGEEVILGKKSHYMLLGGLTLTFKNTKTKKRYTLSISNFVEMRDMRVW